MAKPKTDSPTADAHIIGKEDFLKLMKRVKSEESKAAEARGNMGDLIASAVENKNLHKAAARDARKQTRMDPAKLYAYRQHRAAYEEYFELDKIAGESLPLDEGTAAANAKAAGKRGSNKRATDDDTRGEGDGSKVTDLSERRQREKETA